MVKAEHRKIETNRIINKITSVIDKLRHFEEIHEQSLKNLLTKYDYKHLYNKNLMLSEFHVIDCIGKQPLSNATFISRELNMTKGAISKVAAKLLEKNLIKGNQLENNKKEIYYTLTALGKEAFEIHEQLHKIEEERFMKIINKYNKEELNTINSFLDDLINMQ